ncbi:MAG: citrate/2-methylcitrate synthase [Clostridiales bacterium]|nr:citrate/2-methylcitrate synthase [Clostridiales bacterium]
MKKIEIEREFLELGNLFRENTKFDESLYSKYNVKRGLRDVDGTGVVTGLTDISDVIAKKEVDGKMVPCEGELYYRGINVEDIVSSQEKSKNRFGFEEVIFLLLFNKLPTKTELDEFIKILAHQRKLPRNFVRDVILKAPNADIMNSISKSVLTLYSYDKHALDLTLDNVLKQCIKMISVLPLFAIYSYHSHMHYNENKSLIIHKSDEELSIAENLLHLLRPDGKYTELEAKVLEIALILHAEHGGGNNSTFTMHVVSSAGSDTYSATTAALSSLKGPKHGGANIKVVQMFDDIKKHVKHWDDKKEIEEYLTKMLDKEAFDHTGLIYGVGHAVYSISDPRAKILKRYVEKLAKEKGKNKEFNLYKNVEEIACRLVTERSKSSKKVSANVDFYSGFAYSMLNLPTELYTPVFAVARVAGWSAHRLEELYNASKIIRPAYVSLNGRKKYVKIEER